MNKKDPSIVIIGSGFFGLTIAERFATRFDLPVLVIEKRNHLGGNAYSYRDSESGIEVHTYGTHLFHTSSREVWDYLNSFTKFNSYQHSVVSSHKGAYYSLPINLDTISKIYGRSLSPSEARTLVEADSRAASGLVTDDSFQSRAIKTIGPKLYEALIHGYTFKQWQTDPNKLPGEVFSRLPVRYNFNRRYFNDTWEGLPEEGYGTLFDRISSHPQISIQLETDFFLTKWVEDTSTLKIYTGPIDRYFEYKYGRLSWRTLDFVLERHDVEDFQGTSVLNYPDLDVDFTRIHEFKHLHPERETKSNQTLISYEYSRWAGDEDEPYYPVNSPEDREILMKYREVAKDSPNTIFGGRLGTYKYLDMHMAVASALQVFRNEIAPRFDKPK
jgi:UDP-galactopyranose mutase